MREPEAALFEAMSQLASLAGWYTEPDPRDLTVVRLAITEAKQRAVTDNAMSHIERIEDAWLEYVL